MKYYVVCEIVFSLALDRDFERNKLASAWDCICFINRKPTIQSIDVEFGRSGHSESISFILFKRQDPKLVF